MCDRSWEKARKKLCASLRYYVVSWVEAGKADEFSKNCDQGGLGNKCTDQKISIPGWEVGGGLAKLCTPQKFGRSMNIRKMLSKFEKKYFCKSEKPCLSGVFSENSDRSCAEEAKKNALAEKNTRVSKSCHFWKTNARWLDTTWKKVSEGFKKRWTSLTD